MVQLHVPGLDLRVEAVFSDDVKGLVRAGSAGEQHITEELEGPNVEAILARVDGEPVGCIVLVDRINHGVLRHFFVRPDLRGSGIGTALIWELERAAIDLGLSRIVLQPEDGRRLGARAVEMGYVPAADGGAEGWLAKTLI